MCQWLVPQGRWFQVLYQISAAFAVMFSLLYKWQINGAQQSPQPWHAFSCAADLLKRTSKSRSLLLHRQVRSIRKYYTYNSICGIDMSGGGQITFEQPPNETRGNHQLHTRHFLNKRRVGIHAMTAQCRIPVAPLLYVHGPILITYLPRYLGR